MEYQGRWISQKNSSEDMKISRGKTGIKEDRVIHPLKRGTISLLSVPTRKKWGPDTNQFPYSPLSGEFDLSALWKTMDDDDDDDDGETKSMSDSIPQNLASPFRLK